MDYSGRILVVDTDQSILEFLSMALTDEGYLVAAVECEASGIKLLNSFNPELVLLDMSRGRGSCFLNYWMEHKTEAVAVIGLTTAFQAENRAKELGIDVVVKPFDIKDLLDIIHENLSGLHQ